MKVFGTDYDGVIINIEQEKASILSEILNKHWNTNKKDVYDFWFKNQGTSRRYKFDYFYEKMFGRKLSDNLYEEIESEFSKYLKDELYPNLKLMPGAIDLLEYVKSNYDFSFVSTGIPTNEAKHLIETNGLSKYFDLILGTGLGYKSKDRHESKRSHLQKVISQKKPDTIVYIADGLEDMKIAKEFSVRSMGVTSNHSKQELLDSGACEIADDLYQVVSLIKV